MPSPLDIFPRWNEEGAFLHITFSSKGEHLAEASRRPVYDAEYHDPAQYIDKHHAAFISDKHVAAVVAKRCGHHAKYDRYCLKRRPEHQFIPCI